MDVWQQTVLSKLFIHIQQAGPGYRALNNPAAHDIQYLVKRGKINCATTELYQEEQDMMLDNRFSGHHPNPIRKESRKIAWEKYVKSLVRLDTTDSTAPAASRFEHPQLQRKWVGRGD